MSVKSKNSKMAEPFSQEIWTTACTIAAQYQITLWEEDGEYYAHGVEMPSVMADGKTPDACVSEIRQAMKAAVATMLEMGDVPPAPIGDQNRTEQVNVRLSPAEKMILAATAKSRGFRGVADYVRARVLVE
jgi:predicted RNase H-like HicB family nuclease